MVTFWVDEEFEVGIEVAIGFTDWTAVIDRLGYDHREMTTCEELQVDADDVASLRKAQGRDLQKEKPLPTRYI